jgi:hypothetical protein
MQCEQIGRNFALSAIFLVLGAICYWPIIFLNKGQFLTALYQNNRIIFHQISLAKSSYLVGRNFGRFSNYLGLFTAEEGEF